MARPEKRTVVSKSPLSRPNFPKPPKSRPSSLTVKALREQLGIDKRTKEGKRIADKLEWMEQKRKEFEQDSEADADQVRREMEDIQFYNLDQWPADVKLARAGMSGNGVTPPVPARPCLVLDKTRESVSQVLNEEREADLGIEITAADDFEELVGPIDPTEIELREGLVRRIQRESQAANARSWAFERAVVAGRGYYGVMTRYVQGKTFDQEVFVQGYFNQASVTLDAFHEEPDGSDAKRGWVGSWVPWAEYKRLYPDAEKKRNVISSLNDGDFVALGNDAPKWFTAEGDQRLVYVVDHFYQKITSREVALMPDGSMLWVDELPEDAPEPLDTRDVEEIQIKWAKIDGANPEPLQETDWQGPDIPIIKVTGEQLQPHDNERREQGLIRPARDSQQGFNAMASKLVETIALAPIPPIIMPAGADEGFETEWDLATTRTLGRLHYNQRDLEGNPLLAPPSATPRDVPIQPMSVALGMFDQATQTSMRTHDPSLGKVQPALRSGKTVDALVAQSQRSTSNFMSNLTRSVRREAQIINNLLYPIYGKRPGRIARILSKTGEPMTINIGQPNAQGTTPQLTENANFNVALKVTKNFDTQRQEKLAFLSSLIQADPQMMAVYGDLFFKDLDVPGHNELAERAKLMLAPPIQAALAAKANGGQPLPPEAQQKLAQAQQQMQAAGAEIQKLQAEKQGKVVETQGKMAIEQMRISADADEGAKDRELKLAVAAIDAKVETLTNLMQIFADEKARIGTQAHEVGMAAAQSAHDQNAEAAQSAQEHDQTQQQAVTAAALQPPPQAPAQPDQSSQAQP